MSAVDSEMVERALEVVIAGWRGTEVATIYGVKQSKRDWRISMRRALEAALADVPNQARHGNGE